MDSADLFWLMTRNGDYNDFQQNQTWYELNAEFELETCRFIVYTLCKTVKYTAKYNRI